MSSHSDTQTSETEDEYTREISHNTYRLDNQLVEPAFPMPHIFHTRPLVPPSTIQGIPLLMPPCFPPKPLPFILPRPPLPLPILPIVTEPTPKPPTLIMPPIMPLLPPMSEQLTLPQSVPEIRTTNTLVEPPKQPFMPPFDPNNLARFPPPMVSQPEPQIMPPDLQELPKHSPSFDHKHMPHFPPHFVPIISQADVPKETHLEPPDRHNVPHFPPHFVPIISQADVPKETHLESPYRHNVPHFPPPFVPIISQADVPKETHLESPYRHNVPHFPPPFVPIISQADVPKETHLEPPDRHNVTHFPPPFVPIISQADVPKETHLEPPDRHNMPHFPPPFDPQNIHLFPPPLVPSIRPLEPLKETQFVPLESQEPQKFQLPIDTQNRPIFSPPINPLETQKETHLVPPDTQNQPIFMPRFDPNNILRFQPPHQPTIPRNEPIKSETQNMPLFPPKNIPLLMPQLSPDRQQAFSGAETQIEEPHFEPPEPHFRQPMPHFQPPESEQPKGTHFELQESNPFFEPRFMPPELRETHFISNEPRRDKNIPLHPTDHFQPLFPRNVSQPKFPQIPPPNRKQDRPTATEIFDTSPQSEPKQFPPNIQLEPKQFPHNIQLEPNKFPPNIQLEPKQFPPNIQLEPNQPPPVSQKVPTEMWRPITSENIRFPNPPLFQPPMTQFIPSISSDEQMVEDTSNMEPSEPQTPEPSEPQVLQPIVSQTDLETSTQTFPHYQPGEIEFNQDHDIPGPHYRSMPQHRPLFIRPPFQRPYPPPREQFYAPYPMRHPMAPPRGPARFRPVWTEHVTMDGRVYHHNHETMQSFWEPPEYEEEPIPPFLHHFNPEMQPEPQSEIDTDNPETEPPEDTIQHPATTKPVNSTPVPGSEWCVVWTNDDKVFFFNAVINKSVWQIPNEIKEHPIARKLMERNPDLPVVPIGMGTETETETKRVKLMEQSVELEKDSSGNNSDENTGENVEIVLQQSMNVKLPKKPKIVKNEFTISEEDAKNIRALKPLESRIIEYKEMLLQRGVSAFSTWEKEQPKVAFDPRYILLTAKERKPIFEQFSQERIHEEKREKNLKLKLRKDCFFSLLLDMKVGLKTSFHDFNLKSLKDPRFKEIEKVKEREKLFLEFQANLKKKTKTQTKLSTTEIPTDTFRNYEDKNSKRNRVEASIREREREVSESRRNQKQVIEDQRFLHKREEARIKYKSILTEIVRDTKNNFKTFEKEIKTQPNYNEIIYSLSNDERLNYFEHHIDHLQNKKRTQFQACIDDCHEINLSTPFKKARKLIKNDPRFESISSSDTKRETEYTRHLQTKIKLACDDFNQLLKETKLITYKTKSNIESNSKCLQEIEYILVKDRRYLNLDCIQDERRNILLEYINELSDKGAPPPPTATSPNRTRTK